MNLLNPILVIAVCAVGGGAGFGLGFLQKDSVVLQPAANSQMASTILSVGQFTVPVAKNGETGAFLLAQIRLEMSDHTRVAEFSSRMPKLRSSILNYLFALAKTRKVGAESLDPVALGEELRAMLERDFGADAVRSVLFDRLLIQDAQSAHGEIVSEK